MCRFIGLSYSNNSCYQDSILLCLLAIPNSFVTKTILLKNVNNPYVEKVQDELIKITNIMRKCDSYYNCNNLRKILSRFNPPQDFGGSDTQDAGEFLQYLFRLFNIETTRRKIEIYTSKNLDKKPTLSSKRIETMTPFILIPYHKIDNKLRISDMIENIDDEITSDTQIRKIEYSDIYEAPFLVFNAQRTILGKNRNFNYIYPDRIIKVGNRYLELYGIVIHISNHYTAFIKCNKDHWFFYNDMYDKIKKIGEYRDIFETNLDPRKYGTLYFYKEV
jgi:ubiquitin C-terminal hydrolase